MAKHSWIIWIAPLAVWGVYMSWLSGYSNGYEQGHNEGWQTARTAFTKVRSDLREDRLQAAAAPAISLNQ